MNPVMDFFKQSLRPQEHPLWYDKEVRFDPPYINRHVNNMNKGQVLSHGEFLVHKVQVQRRQAESG